MAKYIHKQAAIHALVNEANIHNNPIKRAYTRAAAIIEQITAEDVQPVKHGKWEKKRGYLVCSNCGMVVDSIGYTYEEQEEVFRYCSCCGYRMDGEQNET